MKPEEIKDYRLKSGAVNVLEHIRKVEENELIFELYLPVKDERTRMLISFYEKQLLLAKLNEKKFIDSRYKQVKEISEWVRKTNSYRLFADFCMYVERNMVNKNKAVLNAYMSALMDTWVNIPQYGYLWYGLDKNDKPLYMKEIYGAYDIEAWELSKEIELAIKKRNIGKVNSLTAKVYELDRKTEFVRNNERTITNVIFSMVGLIDEENQDFIFPKDKWANHVIVSTEIPRQYKPTKCYLDMLDQRSYLLASEGVVVHCRNAGLFSEIRFKEEFLNDGLVVLFRITNALDKGNTMGFIDLRDKYLFSLTKHATANPTNYHDLFMNFILEVYCHLTCQFEKNTNRLVALNDSATSTDDLNGLLLNLGQPAIYCETKEDNEQKNTHGKHKPTQKISHHVNAFLRKGNASEMAIANARQYGLIVPQGYTFVKPHIRGIKKEQ